MVYYMIQALFFLAYRYPVAPASFIEKTIHWKLTCYKSLLPQLKKEERKNFFSTKLPLHHCQNELFTYMWTHFRTLFCPVELFFYLNTNITLSYLL